MRITCIRITLFTTLLLLCANVTASNQTMRHKYTKIEYFKNYALSACIADGYKSKEVVRDATAASRGYLELGDMPIEAYTEVTKIGKKFLRRKYKSISGASLTLMKCIDFYNSKELNNIALKYLHKK